MGATQRARKGEAPQRRTARERRGGGGIAGHFSGQRRTHTHTPERHQQSTREKRPQRTKTNEDDVVHDVPLHGRAFASRPQRPPHACTTPMPLLPLLLLLLRTGRSLLSRGRGRGEGGNEAAQRRQRRRGSPGGERRGGERKRERDGGEGIRLSARVGRHCGARRRHVANDGKGGAACCRR